MSISKLAQRREIMATFAIIGGLVVAVAFLSLRRGESAPTQCEPLFDRYLELRLHASYEKVTPNLIEENEQASRRSDRFAEAIGDCARHLKKETADCAMNAPSADELERCFP